MADSLAKLASIPRQRIYPLDRWIFPRPNDRKSGARGQKPKWTTKQIIETDFRTFSAKVDTALSGSVADLVDNPYLHKTRAVNAKNLRTIKRNHAQSTRKTKRHFADWNSRNSSSPPAQVDARWVVSGDATFLRTEMKRDTKGKQKERWEAGDKRKQSKTTKREIYSVESQVSTAKCLAKHYAVETQFLDRIYFLEHSENIP